MAAPGTAGLALCFAFHVHRMPRSKHNCHISNSTYFEVGCWSKSSSEFLRLSLTLESPTLMFMFWLALKKSSMLRYYPEISSPVFSQFFPQFSLRLNKSFQSPFQFTNRLKDFGTPYGCQTDLSLYTDISFFGGLKLLASFMRTASPHRIVAPQKTSSNSYIFLSCTSSRIRVSHVQPSLGAPEMVRW
ncbi:hypothetical protein BCR34DRAFT_362370 [Clohesyomyces aquaticus]|uniref:Uncharacterized protein n=1 Tax=Clohesyomyces aquaticus TaxID=1231657 RepID=A0A1Y1ZI02_9PLEO|nr:hypothetical protein BCR34DRAFT_362370 [Clohesyomyces aquaticus]